MKPRHIIDARQQASDQCAASRSSREISIYPSSDLTAALLQDEQRSFPVATRFQFAGVCKKYMLD